MTYLDVRTPEEFETGHYPDALNHEVALIQQGIFPNIPKDEEIHVYCRSGARAGVATDLLARAGFTNVTNIGGYQG